MGPSKLHIFVLVLFLVSNLSVIHAGSQVSPYIFREYIGALGLNVTFSDVRINPDVEFHFILSFAIDYTVANDTQAMNSSSNPSNPSLPYPTNGDFNIYWDTDNLSPFHVSDIKAKHPNVKVAMSLGGDTVYGEFVNFSPTSIDSWVSNAISSITKIVNEYHLDGIDIDYEHFNTDPDTFAECIGRLLFHLKENNIISFASIAPYGNETIQEHYTLLWSKYGHLIDYVNFQFYAYNSTTTLDQFLNYFDAQIYNYAGGKILVSFSTGGNGGLTPRHGFFKACKILHTEKKFHGIFIWSADNSMEADFHYEKKSQHFMAHAS